MPTLAALTQRQRRKAHAFAATLRDEQRRGVAKRPNPTYWHDAYEGTTGVRGATANVERMTIGYSGADVADFAADVFAVEPKELRYHRQSPWYRSIEDLLAEALLREDGAAWYTASVMGRPRIHPDDATRKRGESKRRAQRRREAGLCIVCGRESPERATCVPCGYAANERQRRARAAKRKAAA